MAKGSKQTSSHTKITFGSKKGGKAHKSYNKHDRKERNYRGQGR